MDQDLNSVIDAQEASEIVNAWFDQVEVAGLVLPDGWFGRPFDNLHSLTWSAVRGSKLLLELGSSLHLVISAPVSTETDKKEMRLFGFRRLVFDREDFGSGRGGEAKVYHEGDVRFVAHPIGLTPPNVSA